MGRSATPQVHLLHVDDDPDFVDLAAAFLEREMDRCVVETATNPDRGGELLTDDVDCVVSDYEMPGTDGIEFLASVREEYCLL